MTDPEHVSTTRAAYDATAEAYVALIGTEVTPRVEGPLDRAFLATFAGLVAQRPGPVMDIGCGPGRVAAFLAARGLDVVGVDVSPAMLAAARRAHPAIRFEDGRLTDLPVSDGALAGAVCWYSIIHTPPKDLDLVSAELARALAPGAHLLVGFQVGHGERVHRTEIQGTAVSLTNHRHDLGQVVTSLATAGLHVHVRAVREPELPHESTPQGFVLARAGTTSAEDDGGDVVVGGEVAVDVRGDLGRDEFGFAGEGGGERGVGRVAPGGDADE